MSIIDTLSSILGGAQQTAMPQSTATPVALPPQQSNLSALISGNAGFTPMFRAMGAGMANLGSTGGDPFAMFGRGFGGATNYSSQRDMEAAKMAQDQAAEQQRLAMERQRLEQGQSQDAVRNAQWQQEMDLRKATEKRQQIVADQTIRMNEIKIKELQADGIPEDVASKISDSATKAAQAWLEERKTYNETVSDEEYQQVLDNAVRDRKNAYLAARAPGDQPGIRSPTSTLSSGQTATNPKTGEKLILKNGQWVPAQ